MSGGNIAIKVSNLSRCYQIYNQPNDRLKQFIVPKLCRAVPALKRFFPTQSGEYVGEDDIVRFEDNYGRVPSAE